MLATSKTFITEAVIIEGYTQLQLMKLSSTTNTDDVNFRDLNLDN